MQMGYTFHSSVAFPKIDTVCKQIAEYVKNRKIDGVTVQLTNSSYKKDLFVSEVIGKDFWIKFEERLTARLHGQNNLITLSILVIDRKRMNFHDDCAPDYFEYTGNEWELEKKDFMSEAFHADSLYLRVSKFRGSYSTEVLTATQYINSPYLVYYNNDWDANLSRKREWKSTDDVIEHFHDCLQANVLKKIQGSELELLERN